MARYYYDGELDLFLVNIVGNVIARLKYEEWAIQLVNQINS